MESKKFSPKALLGMFILTISFLWSGPASAQGFLNILRAGGDLTGFYPNPTIRQDAVTSAKIQDGAVIGSKIAAGAVTSDKLSATGVTAGTYTNATITVGADGRVSSAESGSGGNGTIEGDLNVTDDVTIGEDLDVTGSATVGEDLNVTGNLTVTGNSSLGAPAIVATPQGGPHFVAIDATSSYVVIDCNSIDTCQIQSIADGRPGQILTIECIATDFSPNSICLLSNNVVPNLAIRGTAFFMNTPDVQAGQGGSGDNITLVWAPRTPFQGGGFRWVEVSRVDH